MGNVTTATDDEQTIPVEFVIANYSYHKIEKISVSDPDLQCFFAGKYIRSQERARFKGNVKIEVLINDNDCPLVLCFTFENGTADIVNLHRKQYSNSSNFFEHVSKSHKIDFESTDCFYEIIVNNTAQQIQNKSVEELKKEAALAIQRKQYEVALGKFAKALRLANNEQIIKTIKRDQANAYHAQGVVLMKKCWDSEGAAEVKEILNEAKLMLAKAENCGDECERQRNLKIIALKTEGNEFLNEAEELEKKAKRLYSEKKYAEAKKKYTEVFIKFKTAQKVFDQGLKIDDSFFTSSSLKSDERVANVLKTLNDIDKICRK